MRDIFQITILEKDVLEVLRLIRVRKNMLAPISKIPPEILAIIPDFWDTRDRDQDVIALTHVCRVWREVFVSRSSLWTDFDCLDEEKTQVYFERSKSSPVNLSLHLSEGISFCNSFFQIIPYATGRLRSLFVEGPLEDVEIVISHLSHPAPLLEHLSILPGDVPGYLALTPALFNGGLSSLRTLRLESVHTELPWRNMVNLTSFTLSSTPPGVVSVGQLLDFFENAPYLEEVELCFAIPTAGAQHGRVVSLECLKSMHIEDDDPPSVFLDHLLIPVGAKLEIQACLVNSLIGEYLPRSLDNLKNFSDFTAIELHPDEYYPGMKFSGPNGQVNMTLGTSRHGSTGLILKSLAELDTSKTERLEIDGSCLVYRESLYQTLLPMKDLRTLTLSKCRSPYVLIYALRPTMDLSEAMVCPKLEELVLVLDPHETVHHITGITEMAAARAPRGGKLKTVRIVGGRSAASLGVSGLGKHVFDVEYSPGD